MQGCLTQKVQHTEPCFEVLLHLILLQVVTCMDSRTLMLPQLLRRSWGCQVTCFPAGRLNKAVNIAISPPEQFDLNQLLAWAFRPADEPTMLGFLEQGRKDAMAWAEDSGVLEAVPVQQEQKA